MVTVTNGSFFDVSAITLLWRDYPSVRFDERMKAPETIAAIFEAISQRFTVNVERGTAMICVPCPLLKIVLLARPVNFTFIVQGISMKFNGIAGELNLFGKGKYSERS